jgi:hypothetical protein
MEDYKDQVEKGGVICRNLTLDHTGVSAVGKLMQAILSVNGQTTCQSQLGTWGGGPTRQGQYSFPVTISLGYTTTKIEKIDLNILQGDGQ